MNKEQIQDKLEQLGAHKSTVDYEKLGESIQWYREFKLRSDEDEQEF